MSTIADSAVGAILEIPPAALNQIYKAQRAIEGLQMTSKHAAEEVSKHWGTTAVDGLTKFINQVNEAKTKMGSLGDIKFNINIKDSGLSTLTQTLSQSAGTISQIAQQLAQLAPNANNAAISIKNVSDQILKTFPEKAGMNIDQLSTAIKNINEKLKNSQGGVPRRADEQYLVNLRARYQEELKILNQSDTKRQEIADKDAQRKQRELDRNSEIGRRRNEQYNKDIESERMLDNARKKAFDDYEKKIQKEEQLKQQQTETQRRFNQALREADASRIAKAEADAQRQTTDILSRKVNLQQKITELETKQSMATAKIGPALTAKESGDLTRYTAEMARLDSQLNALATKYPKMVADVNRAFDVRKVELFTDAYNRLNEALNKSNTGKHDTAESKLNKLYEDRLRIVKEITQLNNTGMLNIAKGAAQPLSADQNRLLTDLQTKLAGVDREIGTIANSYKGLALKAKHAYGIEELRQAIKLQEQYDKQLAVIESKGIRSQLADYKRLTTEAQKLAQSMREYTTAGGDKSSAAYTQLEQRFRAVMAERRTLEMKNVDEINNYRQQRMMSAYLDDLSRFVQTEAQKRIEQQKTIDEQVAKAKIAGQQYAQSFQGAMAQFNQMMAGNAKGGLALNLENIKRVLSDLQTAAGKLNILDPADAAKAKQLESAIKTLNGVIKKYKDIANAKPDKPVISPQDAINAARSATSLKQLQDAYKNLKAVMSTTDPKSDIWKQMNTVLRQTKTQIDNIHKKMGELQSQSKRTGDVLSQLKGQLGAVFSISAITGYIKKMVDVRAQFELQNVALRAILQNKDEADRIFTQVQQMALQSPFTIMQLTTYTKQLAAYRIEADKLVDTTKMLADVSAGLGVSMDRLILAYGQVKAANYLRATEVRQFTEAGLNITGELANYFSELQGKMISVGDVMEMITKRMVRFEDVEEVFKRVTSAGGLFYDMQKKQAETLSGQLQRITDAYNIMLNEIGKSNQSNISKALTMIRSLISQWRIIVPLIETVGAIMAAVFVPKAIIAMVRSIKSMNLVLATTILRWRGVNDQIIASNLAMKTTIWGAVISAAVVLTSVLIGVNDQLNAVNDELGRIRDEGTTDMYNLIYKYQDLANTLSSTTTSYEKQKEALDELQRTYKDILPSEMLEIENIRAMSDGYEAATNAIREYSIEKTKQKSMEAIDASQREQFNNWQNEIVDKGWKDLMKKNNIDTTEEELKGRIRSFTDMIYQEIQDGTLKTEDALTRFSELFAKYYGLSETKITRGFKDIFDSSSQWLTIGVDNLNKIIERFDKKRAEIEAQFDQTFTFKQRGQMLAAKPQTEQYEALTKTMDDYAKAIRAVKNEGGADIFNAPMDSLSATQQTALDGLYKQLVAVNQLRDAMGLIPISLKDIQAAMDSNMDAEAHLREVSQQTFEGMLSDIEEFAKATKNDALVAWVGNMRRELEKVDLSDTQKQIQNVIFEVEKANNVNLGDFRWALLDSKSTVSSVAADVKKEVESLQESIKKYETAVAEGLPAFFSQLFFLGGKTLDEVKETLKAVDELSKKLGNSEKQKKNRQGKDPILKQWEDRRDALKRYYAAAEKARKQLNVAETETQQRFSFEDLWQSLGMNKLEGLSFNDLIEKGFDPKKLQNDYVGALNQLLTLIPNEERFKELRNKIQEDIASESIEIQFKIKEQEREKLQKDIDNLFANMELTKTFADLGLNIDLTYIVGGKPTTIADVRKQLESMSADMSNKSLEEQKIYQKALEALRKKEHDNQIARIKNYNKYLLESMSERVQIELKAMQDINKIRNDETLDQFSKNQAILNRRKKMQEDLTKFDFDQFKGTDVYIDTFKDLEKASKEQLQYVIDKLRELQSVNKDLSPVQVKSIANEIRKAQDALGSKTSFSDLGSNLVDSIKYAKNRNQLLQEQVALQKNIDSQNSILSTAEKELYNLTLKRDAIQDKSSNEWVNANMEVSTQQVLVNSLIALIEKLTKKQQEVTNKISKGEQAWINFKGGLDKIHEKISQVKDATDSIFDGLDSMGLVSDSFRDSYESISEIIGGIEKTMDGLESIDIRKPFSIVTGVAKTIGGIFSSIGGIFSIGDKKKERQIKRLQERVENLDKAYQKLEKSIETAYTFDQYNAGYKQMQENLESQKAAYEEMIRLEEAKKKTDKDKVKEYKDKLEELAEAEKEQHDQRIEVMGSTTDYMSEAENFVSAWLDAYKETGDGLDALKDNLDKFIENLFTKQAAARIVSSRLKGVIDMINAAIDSGATDFDLADAVNKAREEWAKEAEIIEPILEQLFGSYGLGKGNGDFILSDLQKGIQNITEPQAAAIEAYLNSMRFAVFQHTEQLNTLIATIQAQYGSGAENPVVTELKGIRTVLDSIDKRLGSVIDNRVGRGASIRIAG